MKLAVAILFTVVMTAGFLTAGAQTRVGDNLRRAIENDTNSRSQLTAILALCELSINPDTLLPYADMAASIARHTKNRFDAGCAALARAYYQVRKNYIDSSLLSIDTLLPEYKKIRTGRIFTLNFIFLNQKYWTGLTGIRRRLPSCTRQKKSCRFK